MLGSDAGDSISTKVSSGLLALFFAVQFHARTPWASSDENDVSVSLREWVRLVAGRVVGGFIGRNIRMWSGRQGARCTESRVDTIQIVREVA